MAKGSETYQALLDALVGLNVGDISKIRRVVVDIDLQQQNPITVYTERYGDPKDAVRILKAASKVDVVNTKTEGE